MTVEFQDYYEVLGVPRDASKEDIQRAYRKLARKHHPDVAKDPGASDRFKRIAEAYEVLKDPEKRKRYDALGAHWKSGQEFTPPPGWEQTSGAPFEFDLDGMGDFSSFFETLFGHGFGPRTRGGSTRFRGAPRRRSGQPLEASIAIPLADAYRGGKRTLTLESTEVGDDGLPRASQRTYDVTIPPGTTSGSTIRLRGQGAPGSGGGPPGDLLLHVEIAPDPRFRLEGHDLGTTVLVAPHEAVLGAKVSIPTPEGEVLLTVPAGSSSGRKLRLRGLGLPKRDGGRGDLIAELAIAVPAEASAAERKLYEELARVSKFDPRQ